MTRARRILLGTVSIFLGAVVAFGQSSGATDRAEALAEAARAHEAVMQPGRYGKIVLIA